MTRKPNVSSVVRLPRLSQNQHEQNKSTRRLVERMKLTERSFPVLTLYAFRGATLCHVHGKHMR
jgi:hypothetical protein